jgi:hypothetical protein
MTAVDGLTTTPMARGRVRRRAHLSIPAFAVLAAALALAACGGVSAAPSSSAPAAGGHNGRSTTATAGGQGAGSGGSSSGGSTSGIPKACALVSASQVSAALGVPINRTSGTPDGSGTECSWTYKTTSLVKGLGSSATLKVTPSPTDMTRSAYYRSIENVQALKFAPAMVDGIPAVRGMGSAQIEVLVDIGPVTMTVAALSTLSPAVDGPAALAIAGDAVANACRTVRCSH